jgi:hypothetical protein
VPLSGEKNMLAEEADYESLLRKIWKGDSALYVDDVSFPSVSRPGPCLRTSFTPVISLALSILPYS